jgi:transcriptional regulator of acetoin/glycerol metabolism
VLLASGTAIDWTDLRIDNTNSDAPPPPHESLSETERRRIEEVLQRTGRNVQQAAKLLGLSRGALYRRLERYGL